MSIIEFNDNVVVKTILPGLEDTIDGLNDAISKIGSLDVPSFGGSGTIDHVSTRLTEIRANMVYAKSWIIRSNANYTKCAEELSDDLIAIKSISVVKHNVTIR